MGGMKNKMVLIISVCFISFVMDCQVETIYTLYKCFIKSINCICVWIWMFYKPDT